jgi:hypothetical protein
MFETDFLAPLELHYAAIVDHQLDCPVADGLQGLLQLPKGARVAGESDCPESAFAPMGAAE